MGFGVALNVLGVSVQEAEVASVVFMPIAGLTAEAGADNVGRVGSVAVGNDRKGIPNVGGTGRRDDAGKSLGNKVPIVVIAAPRIEGVGIGQCVTDRWV